MNAITPIREDRQPLAVGVRPSAIVPQTMDDAYRMAKAICMARLAPKGLDTPEACMVAIMHGMEIGLTPMTALQRLAVVNGRPTIWGDGAMSLVRASGLCEYVRETQAGQGDAFTATCEAKRRGEDEPIVRTFSVADAKRAQLWDKGGPWKQYPTRMLQMRARAFALRDGFADVLGGLYLREEIEEDARGPSRVSGEPRQAPAGPPRRVAQRETAAALPAPDADAEAEACVAQFEADVQHARSEQDIEECAGIVSPLEEGDRLSRAQRKRIETAMEAARERIAAAAKPSEDEGEEAPVDPSDPDFQRGQKDRRDGLKKCVIAAIRESEERFVRWKAGYDAAGEEEAA